MLASLPVEGESLNLTLWLVVIHVASAILLIAPSGAFAVLGKRASDPAKGGFHMLEAMLEIEHKYVLPGSVVQLVTGLWLMVRLDLDQNLFDHLWLVISLVLFIALLGLSTAVDIPAIKRIVAAAKAGNAPDPKDIKVSMVLGPIFGIMFVIITFLMMIKPF